MIQPIIRAFSDLLFPPLCIHCLSQIEGELHHFCRNCFNQLELISPQERCPFCFSPQYCTERRTCPECHKNPPLLDRIAAAFDYYGPASTLVKKMKYGSQYYLADGAAAYMAAQFLQLDWNFPDYLIPVPISTAHWLERGYNQSKLIAEALGELIKVPVIEPIGRRSGDYSQAGLTRAQRLELKGSNFYLKKTPPLLGKRLLIIDDVFTTGSTLRRCAEILYESSPAAVHGFVFTRTVR